MHTRSLLTLLWMSLGSLPVAAQDIVIDWTARKLEKSPPKVERVMAATVRVKNINNLLYSYKIDVTEIPRQTDDLVKLIELLRGFAPAAQPRQGKCASSIDAAKNALRAFSENLTRNENLNPTANRPTPRSIPLVTTKDAWESSEIQGLIRNGEAEATKLRVLLDDGTCAAENVSAEARMFLEGEYGSFERHRKGFREKLDAGQHWTEVSVALSPERDYEVVVTEWYGAKETEGSRQEYQFSPTSNILTLSGGALFSRIQNRSYLAVRVPNMENQLAVENTGRLQPQLVALLNYRIPRAGDRDEFGLAFSSGPTFRPGSKSEVSNLGFFIGMSGYLWRRFYITPGVHIAEFGDFPRGFSMPGDMIPANFGELKPIKRWTVRFAFSITYQTLSFDLFTKKGQDSGQDSGEGSGKKK